jgi:hypothetical protein
MYGRAGEAIFVLCLMIKHIMKIKLFENSDLDTGLIIVTALLVVTSLFGQDLKQWITDDETVKFVLDSYYTFEKSLSS